MHDIQPAPPEPAARSSAPIPTATQVTKHEDELVPHPPRLAARAAIPAEVPRPAPEGAHVPTVAAVPALDSGAYQDILRALADNKRLAEWFTETVVGEVDRRAAEREVRRERQHTKVLAVLGLIGIAGFTGFTRSSVDTQVDTALASFVTGVLPEKIQTVVNTETDNTRAGIDESINGIRSEFRSAYSLVRLFNLVSMQGDTVEFTDDHRDNIMALMREIERTGAHRDRLEFPTFLEKTIDPFVSAELDERVDEIVDLFPLETRMTPGIVFTLVLHYGARLAGNVRFEGENLDRLQRRFELFEQAAHTFHIDELALPYRLLVEFERAGLQRSTRADAFLAAVGGLSEPRQIARVVRELGQLTHFAFRRFRETEQSHELARLSTGFLATYGAEVGEWLARPGVGQQFVELSRQFTPDDESELLLTLAAALDASGVPVDPIVEILDKE